jgi:hypothetical protein
LLIKPACVFDQNPRLQQQPREESARSRRLTVERAVEVHFHSEVSTEKQLFKMRNTGGEGLDRVGCRLMIFSRPKENI